MAGENHHDKPVGTLRWIPWLVGIGVFLWLYSAGPTAHAPEAGAPQKVETPAPESAPRPAAPAEKSQEPNSTKR